MAAWFKEKLAGFLCVKSYKTTLTYIQNIYILDFTKLWAYLEPSNQLWSSKAFI